MAATRTGISVNAVMTAAMVAGTAFIWPSSNTIGLGGLGLKAEGTPMMFRAVLNLPWTSVRAELRVSAPVMLVASRAVKNDVHFWSTRMHTDQAVWLQEVGKGRTMSDKRSTEKKARLGDIATMHLGLFVPRHHLAPLGMADFDRVVTASLIHSFSNSVL